MNKAYDHLRVIMNNYHPISDQCFEALKAISTVREFKKNQQLIRMGEIPKKYYFLHLGLIRAFTLNSHDHSKEVNKAFFEEGRFPASVIASLKQVESEICLEALEDSLVIEFDHSGFRGLLDKYEDLKWYHIKYLEKHWVMEKEPFEISLIGAEAKQRYLDFLENYPGLSDRLPLYHIASRLGITATQLSRIRNSLKK